MKKEEIRGNVRKKIDEATLGDEGLNAKLTIDSSSMEEVPAYSIKMQTPSERHAKRIAKALRNQMPGLGTPRIVFIDVYTDYNDESVVVCEISGESKDRMETVFIDTIKSALTGYDVNVKR